MYASASPFTPLSEYIFGLDYDENLVLSQRVDPYEVTHSETKNGVFYVTNYEKHSFKDVSADFGVMDSVASNLYPGALVTADSHLLDGSPNVITVSNRAPLTIHTNLPLPSGERSILVENVSASAVNAAADDLAGRYLASGSKSSIGAQSKFDMSHMESESQLYAELGYRYGGLLKSKLNINASVMTTDTKSTRTAYYQQVYYTISVDDPASPDEFFSDTSADTIAQLQRYGVSDATPPAYISSVSYGRLIAVMMESTSTSTEVDAAFKAMFGKNKITAGSTYESILKNSKFTYCVWGGNEKDGATLTSDFSTLYDLIASGAEFNSSNRGMPISYSVKFLRDNHNANIITAGNYTTATTTAYTSGKVTFTLDAGYVAQYWVDWDEFSYDANGNKIVVRKHWKDESVSAGVKKIVNFPANTENISFKVHAYWGPDLLHETGKPVGTYTIHSTGALGTLYGKNVPKSVLTRVS
jgi:thiol-activated cytolysin